MNAAAPSPRASAAPLVPSPMKPHFPYNIPREYNARKQSFSHASKRSVDRGATTPAAKRRGGNPMSKQLLSSYVKWVRSRPQLLHLVASFECSCDVQGPTAKSLFHLYARSKQFSGSDSTTTDSTTIVGQQTTWGERSGEPAEDRRDRRGTGQYVSVVFALGCSRPLVHGATL